MEGSKDKQAIANFIDFMPDSKLEGLPSTGGTIHKNFDFHFDMQGMTSGTPVCHKLQVQVSNAVTRSTLKKHKKQTVAECIAPKTPNEVSAGAIETVLKASIGFPPAKPFTKL